MVYSKLLSDPSNIAGHQGFDFTHAQSSPVFRPFQQPAVTGDPFVFGAISKLGFIFTIHFSWLVVFFDWFSPLFFVAAFCCCSFFFVHVLCACWICSFVHLWFVIRLLGSRVQIVRNVLFDSSPGIRNPEYNWRDSMYIEVQEWLFVKEFRIDGYVFDYQSRPYYSVEYFWQWYIPLAIALFM